MPLGPNDMILPHMAMVAVTPPMTFEDASFEDRCRAAAAGGFAGLGIAPRTYRTAREEGRSDADLRAMLAEHELVLAELEPGRFSGPLLDSTLDEIVDIAGALGGCDHAFFIAGADSTVEDSAQAFARACDRLAPLGMRVGVEFMPIPTVSALHTLRDAERMLDLVDRPNSGVIVDTYHFVNSGADWEALEGFDGERVVAIQFTDGAVPPVVDDYIQDSIRHREPPGEGAFPLDRFIRTLDRIGNVGPWEVEVIDDDMAVLDPETRGRRLGESTRAVLTAARTGNDN
jgi:sugar phosphate isomerase/epimerase